MYGQIAKGRKNGQIAKGKNGQIAKEMDIKNK